MTTKISQLFLELEQLKNKVQDNIVQKSLKNEVNREISNTVKKTKIKTDFYCDDIAFSILVLPDKNLLYSIAKKINSVTVVDLSYFPPEIVKSLLETVLKRKLSKNLKLKTTITETVLTYIFTNKLDSNCLLVINLDKKEKLDPNVSDVLSFIRANLKITK